jgi:hypothetical protein
MGSPSPNYDEKLPKKRAVIARLRDAYGPDLPVRIGYGSIRVSTVAGRTSARPSSGGEP